MKKLLIFFLVIAGVLFIIPGCVPSKPTDDVEILPSERLINKLEVNRRKIKSFEGSGTINVKANGADQSASFRVILQKPDSLYLTIMGPFGIELAQAVVTDNSYIFYDALQNTAYQGNIDSDILQQIFKIDLSFDELMNAFIGSVNLTDNLYQPPTNYSIDYDKYVLTYIDPQNNHKTIYRVDIRQLGITDYNIFDEIGSEILAGKYSDFELFETVAVPYKIDIQNTIENQKVSIEYKNISVNKDNIAINFKVRRCNNHKMVRKFLYIFCFFVYTLTSFQQDDINKKKSELQDLKDEISKLENQIKQQTKKEKESYSAVENYNKQNHLLNRLISKLRDEERKKQAEIIISQNNIEEIEKQIDLLQKNYAHYVTSIYKYGKMDELAAVFDSDSFEQAALRVKYLQRFSDKRENDLKVYEKSKEELIVLKQQLEKERKEKALLAGEKEKEESGLKTKLSEKKKILKTIRNNKAELKKELKAKKNAEGQIKNLIARLVEEAERKKEEELALTKKNEKGLTNENPTSSSYDVDLSTTGFETFSTLKGRLTWPVTGGKIIRRFGENRNQKLNTVTLNYGVDIKASGDLNVKSVAGGVISAIDYIPGYGSVIIVTHKGDYRTVYSHLSEIYVNEGDKIKRGSLLAKVGESIEGNILHFEIWNSRNNQNPENWLAKK